MSTIEEIVKSYNPKNLIETKLVLRELVQQIVLIGLSRSGFFNYASFYGGTALRIFYNLSRYSEDLDFTLNKVDTNFSLDPYISKITDIAKSYGLDLIVSTNVKQIDTPIESAFAKLNTYQAFIDLNLNNKLISTIHKDEVIKVKFEIDTNPSVGFNIESKWLDIPEFANINVLNLESLFAGKIHAILCRNYKNHVKGRDYYDYLFYIRKRVKPNMGYLRNKLIDSNKLNESDLFNMEILKNMLIKRFNEVDFKQVSDDARKFIINGEDLSYYCKELFIQMTDKLE